MMPIEVNTLLAVLGETPPHPPYARPSRRVTHLCWDSREVTDQSIFVALPGEHVDGNDFIFRALQAGSPLVIATREPSAALRAQAGEFESHIVYTEDAHATLAVLAGWYRDRLGARVIGVTGSSGKTTTKDLIASVLSPTLVTVATEKNHNNELGVPQTVLAADDRTQALVVEMGMRGFHQIEQLCSFVRPDIAVITNIGASHMELLGSRRNIALAKGEMIAGLPDGGGVAILCGDDDFTPFLIDRFCHPKGCGVITYGLSDRCTIRGTGIVLDDDARPTFRAELPDDQSFEVRLPIPGKHNVRNALAAIAVAYTLGIGTDRMEQAFAQGVQVTGMRMEVIRGHGGITVINDAYNANPDSMAAGLETLASVKTDGRRIAVLGDMGELGADSVAMHRRVGELVAQRDVDLLVCVGRLSRNIASAACNAGLEAGSVFQFDTTDEAIALLRSITMEGDVLFVKASHAMGLERIVEGLVD